LASFASALAAAVEPAAAEFMAGADISSLAVFEQRGAVYRDNGAPRDVIEMFRDHGVNWCRLRLFVDPKFENNYDGGYDPFVAQDLNYTIALAQRVKQSGGKVLLDFHYSDTWADPGHQWKPEAWKSLATMDLLQQQVYDYTRQSIEAFHAAGVPPQMVQIGNEIANGLLWNDPPNRAGANSGYPWTGGSNSAGLNRLATLLTAGVKGARDGAGDGDKPLIMIHHDKGSQWGTTEYFFDQMLPRLAANDADVDVIGYSYYPQFHSGGVAGVQRNLNNTAAAYGKPVVLVETGFPSRNPQSDEQNLGFPVTEAGQRAFLDAVVDAVENVPNDLGWGVFWWYPEARPLSGLGVWESGRYGWFDSSGNLLPTIDAFAGLNPLPTPGDFNGDGVVDGEDLAAWQSAFGEVGAGLAADGDDDGNVDGADFLLWQQALSAMPANAPSAAIPEPSTHAFAICFLAATAWTRRLFAMRRRSCQLR
jgi:arabinogalactan endo-1,4-beta-galactosidase